MGGDLSVILTWAETFDAAIIGVMRQVQNLRDGRSDKFGASPTNGWELHVQGACGEKAVAKHLGIYWSGNLGHLRADDVGLFQVRTRSNHDYELILHPDDPDDRVWILVTGVAPQFRIVGWCYGHEGKNKAWWKDPAGNRPAYFVPQQALRSMDELVKLFR